ncbi:MAG: hypothetical protein ACR2PQ_13180 [Myxococcota bacterium]
MESPYLDEPLRERFDTWLRDACDRCMPPLSFPEVRKGVRALSSLYVEKRAEKSLAQRSLDGAGKRAAFATCYAPLHFLTLHHGLREIDADWLGGEEKTKRVVDLGGGTGAAGAALATALTKPVPILAVDRSGWALGEARRTYAAFGLSCRTVRGALPRALPRPRSGDIWVAGWSVNECDERTQAALLGAFESASKAGVRVLIAEPLAGPVTPWWEDWAERLGPHGFESATIRARLELPAWLRKLDVATGLDHRTLGARLLWGPA